MIGSLIRWFGREAATKRSRRGAVPARRFTPRLEALEGRAVPAVFSGGGVVASVTAQAALLGANVGGSHDVAVRGSQLGIAPSNSALSGGGEVMPFGSKAGCAGDG